VSGLNDVPDDNPGWFLACPARINPGLDDWNTVGVCSRLTPEAGAGDTLVSLIAALHRCGFALKCLQVSCFAWPILPRQPTDYGI
jgi:hypothetical protein